MVELRGRQYRVTRKDGTEVNRGDTVYSRDEPATFRGLDRGPEYNGTSKVVVTWDGKDYGGSYYHFVFGLTVTPVEPSIGHGRPATA